MESWNQVPFITAFSSNCKRRSSPRSLLKLARLPAYAKLLSQLQQVSPYDEKENACASPCLPRAEWDQRAKWESSPSEGFHLTFLHLPPSSAHTVSHDPSREHKWVLRVPGSHSLCSFSKRLISNLYAALSIWKKQNQKSKWQQSFLHGPIVQPDAKVSFFSCCAVFPSFSLLYSKCPL